MNTIKTFSYHLLKRGEPVKDFLEKITLWLIPPLLIQNASYSPPYKMFAQNSSNVLTFYGVYYASHIYYLFTKNV